MHSQNTDFLANTELDSYAPIEMTLPNHINFSPKVSVIIPCYNVEHYLRECLDSVINQTLKEIEIICIDDGSTDASLEIIREYQRRDNRIALIVQENKKQGAARNNGLKIATGEYVYFVDSDDYIDLHACENLYAKCKSLDLDMLIYRASNFDNNTREILSSPYYEFRYLPEDWDKEVFSYRECRGFLPRMAVTTFLTIYKRAFIEEKKIAFPEKIYFEDNVFFITSITQAERVSIDKNLYYYRRIHSDSTTQNWSKHFKDYLQVIELVLQYLKRANIDKHIYLSYKNAYLGNAKVFFKKFSSDEQEKYLGNLMCLINRYNKDDVILGDNRMNQMISEEDIGIIVDNLLSFYREKIVQDFDVSVGKKLDTYRMQVSQDVVSSMEKNLVTYRKHISADIESQILSLRKSVDDDVKCTIGAQFDYIKGVLESYSSSCADIESQILSLRKSVDDDVKCTIETQLDYIKGALESYYSSCKEYIDECVEKKLVAHGNAVTQVLMKFIDEKLQAHSESNIAYYDQKHRDGLEEMKQALLVLERKINQSNVADRQLVVKKLQQDNASIRREWKQSQELIRKTIRDLSQYRRYVRMYCWYKLLQYLTFGKRRRHYKEKANKLRQSISEIRNFIKAA